MYESIGTNIKLLRNKYGWKQLQLAQKLNVSNQTISNWEVGRKMPRMEYIEKMSRLFNVSKSKILDGKIEKPASLSNNTSGTVNVYARIKEIADQHETSLKEVALKSGIGENAIYRWKKNSPTLISLQKVANCLHVSLEDLVSDPNDKESATLREIQREVKLLSNQEQAKLLILMKTIFDNDSGKSYRAK